ncbi:S8 family serine peptidase [Larkinella sp. C7]|uniref:S8 family serine peptidase n=1 Tax=Larkinella sp. C7 TaxID=2576607 RepID=UPI0011113B0E|nr:S8 family serine peptidase [Larkinella sp. C7]
MRIFTRLLILSVAFWALLSCDLIRSYPESGHLPDQNIILFSLIDVKGAKVAIPVAKQKEMVDSVNKVLLRNGKETLKIKHWCPCDSALVLLEGKRLDQLIISGKEMASSTGGGSGVSGEPPYGIKWNPDGSLNWPQLDSPGSKNYRLSMPYGPVNEPGKAVKVILPPANPTDQPFIIAILDTGFDGSLYTPASNSFWVNTAEVSGSDHDHNGLVGDQFGYDFVNNASFPYDDNNHGTLVTSLIHEQLRNNPWATGKVRFMHLKTFGANGQGTLFDNLCALSYARQMNAKMINASWGFYSQQESKLLGHFIQQLNTTGITLVAAAGNKIESLERNPLGWLTGIYRNLDTNPFWPAAFSTTHENVIAVTTIHSDSKESKANPAVLPEGPFAVCPNQNYSSHAVNIGVLNNLNLKETGPIIPGCEVLDITATNGRTKSGSSFAAPVVTGKLVNKLGPDWSAHKRAGLYTKMRTLSPTTLKTDPSLTNQLKDHYVLRHEP